MSSPSVLLREMRQAADLSQRALARQAGTSQPAIARYESGSTTPSWETLQRLAVACGWRIRLHGEAVPDPHDVELADRLLELTPLERLRSLRNFNRLRRISTGDGRRR